MIFICFSVFAPTEIINFNWNDDIMGNFLSFFYIVAILCDLMRFLAIYG